MKIEISGSKCISCGKYTQYYQISYEGNWEPIDCGYCGQKSKTVRPGDRCSYYHEKTNAPGLQRIVHAKSSAVG